MPLSFALFKEVLRLLESSASSATVDSLGSRGDLADSSFLR